MQISLKVDVKEIELGLLKASRSGINAALHNAANGIKADIVNMVDDILTNTDAYKSLENGLLRAEFGLENPEPALRDILNTIKNSVNVSVVPVSTVGKSLQGGIVITMIKSGFEDVLSLSTASYQGKNFPIPWLEWLLLQGDRIIITGYHITYNLSETQKRNSLSGKAVMEKGGSWRVPAEFAGTVEDNFITRAFNVGKVKSVVNDIVQKRLIRSLK